MKLATSVRLDQDLLEFIKQLLPEYKFRSVGDLVNDVFYYIKFGSNRSEGDVKQLIDDVQNHLIKTNYKEVRDNSIDNKTKEEFKKYLSDSGIVSEYDIESKGGGYKFVRQHPDIIKEYSAEFYRDTHYVILDQEAIQCFIEWYYSEKNIISMRRKQIIKYNHILETDPDHIEEQMNEFNKMYVKEA